jgi:hypothetical protein
MRSGDVALRLSIVFLVAGIIALLAGLYEIDRREKSSSATLAANVAEIEQRIQVLTRTYLKIADCCRSDINVE